MIWRGFMIDAAAFISTSLSAASSNSSALFFFFLYFAFAVGRGQSPRTLASGCRRPPPASAARSRPSAKYGGLAGQQPGQIVARPEQLTVALATL